MVGANNGDIIKYNMDYVQENMASTIIYPTTPFIQKEYIHPNNAIKGFVLTNGISEKYGNKVYRELFHYHNHKIVLLDVINTISPYIISMDQSGRVALWYYNSEYFEGKCWFRPYRTTKLVLNVVDLLPTGECIGHSVYNSVGDGGNTDDSDVHTTLLTTDDKATGNTNDTNTTPSTDLDERVKSQLTVREAFVDSTTNSTMHANNTSSGNTTNAHSGSSIVGNRIHKIYNPVYNPELDAHVQYSSVEYDVVVDDEPVVSNTAGGSGDGDIGVGDSSTSGSVKADPVTSATPNDTITTIADGGTTVSSNRNVDANGIRVFSDAPDTTTIAPSDSTAGDNANPITDNTITTTETDTFTNAAVDTTTDNNTTNTTSDAALLTTIPQNTNSEGENKEVRDEEALPQSTTGMYIMYRIGLLSAVYGIVQYCWLVIITANVYPFRIVNAYTLFCLPYIHISTLPLRIHRGCCPGTATTNRHTRHHYYTYYTTYYIS